MKKGFLIGLTAVGVLFLLLVLAPWLISLNQYKAMIQQKAFEATGREVIVEGDVRFGILPSPYARLTDVVVKNPPGTVSKEFARIAAVDVGVALAPLLSKKIQITHITITEPAITLETMANGSNNWQFQPVSKDTSTTTEETSNASSSDNALSIDELSIEKGYVRIVNVPEKSQQMIGPLNAQFNIASLQGPITGKGNVKLMDKVPVDFEAMIESLPKEENGTIPFTADLSVFNKKLTGNLKGTIQKGATTSARIETAIAAEDLGKLLAAASKDGQTPALPAWMQGKAILNGLVEYKDNQAVIDNLMLRSGGMEITGSLKAETGDKTSITLDLANVTMPPEAAGTASSATKKSDKNQTLAQSLNEGFAQIVGMLDTQLPTTPLNIVVTAAQLPLPNQPVLRDVRLAASADAKGVTIQNIETKLPGYTQIKLSGNLPVRQDGKIASANIKAAISSNDLQAAFGDGSQGTAEPVSIMANAAITRQDLRLQPIEITQNGQTVKGNVIYNPKSAEALTAAIQGSALDLDKLLGSSKAPGKSGKTNQTTAKADSDPLAKLQGLKAKLNADLGSVTYQGKTAKAVTIQSTLSEKGLEIPQARIGDLGGMVIEAKGSIQRLNPLAGANLQAQAKTPNLSTTLRALGNKAAANLGASSFDASISGDAKALKIALNGVIDQGKLALNGTAKDINTSPGFDGSIDVSHPETSTILRNFAKMQPKINLGAFALKSNIDYGADTLKVNDLLVKMGTAGTLQGHINITPQNGTRHIDADLKADKLALAAIMGDDTQTNAAAVDTKNPDPVNEGWSQESLDLEALRDLNGKARLTVGELLYKKFVIHNLNASLKFANNIVTLEQLRGGLFDAGTFNINGQLAPGKQGQAHRGDIQINIDDTDAVKLFAALGSKPFNKGTLDLEQKIRFSGASPFIMINNLNGDGTFKVTDGIINGIDLDALATKLDRPNSLSDFAAIIDQARAGGQTAIGDLTMPITIRNGVAQVPNTPIKTQKTAMAMEGTVNLPARLVDMKGQIQFVEQRNLPALTLLVKGPMNNPQKSFDTRSFTNFYAQKATEKLKDKAMDKLGDVLGLPKASEPVTTPEDTTTAPAESGAPAPAAMPTKQDPLKQLGNDMLQNLLGGNR